MYCARISISAWLVVGTLSVSSTVCLAAAQEVNAEKVVTALEGTFGTHPGQRRNHTKGTCAVGQFVGYKEAQPFTRSALFSGSPLQVIARFSLPGGNPKVPDTARTPRGMALEIRLPEGGLQHMTMLNTPMFGAASPQTFLDAILAKTPDPKTGKPDPAKIKAFKKTHPDSHAQARYLSSHNPPVSWANSDYFGIHTFKFVNRKDEVTLVRWRFVPRDGIKRLTDEELTSLPPHFLEQRLIERTRQGPVQWDMILTIGKPGDPEDNPTLLWPSERREIKVGTLTLTAAMPEKGAGCENINFDPLVMTDGIEPGNDPVLLFRSPAYAVSFGKRLSGQ